MKEMIIETQRLILRSFVNDPDGTPGYENTYEYAILKKEWKNKESIL